MLDLRRRIESEDWGLGYVEGWMREGRRVGSGGGGEDTSIEDIDC